MGENLKLEGNYKVSDEEVQLLYKWNAMFHKRHKAEINRANLK